MTILKLNSPEIMYKTNFLFYFLILPAILLLSSCRFHKSTVMDGGYAFNVKVDNSGLELNFNDEFYDGYKAMMIDEDYPKAISKFEQCLEIYPNSTAVMFNLASLYLYKNRDMEAIRLLEKATTIDKENKWYLDLLARLYIRQKNYGKAEKAYETILKYNPYDLPAYFNLTTAQLYAHEPLKAIKTLDRVEAITGISEELTEQKKKIWLSINKLDKAVEEVNKLIKSDPGQTDYIRLLIDLYLANGQDSKVMPLYEEILKIDSTDGRSELVVADFLIRNQQRSKGMELAEKAFRNTSLDIEDKITFLMYNFLFKKDSSNIKSVMHFSDILTEVHPENPRAYAFRGDVLSEIGRKEEALKDYKQALVYEKSLIVLWKKVILLDFDRRDYKDCIKVAKEALDYFPNDPEIYFYLGVAYNMQKDYESAVKTFEKGLDWVVGNEALKEQYYSNLGETYNSLKEYDKSDASFEKALKIDSKDATAMNNYAYYLSLRKEKLDQAAKMSEKSIDIEPQNPAFLDTYGWIMYLKGDFDQALKFIGKALTLKPNDADILEHYGDVLFKQGKTDEALENWEKAARNGGKSEILQKKIREKKLYE